MQTYKPSKNRRKLDPIDSTGLEEVTIAVVGSVDSSKSSTVGTLVSGVLDDGNGLSRSTVFIHPHERQSGRTSDISYQYFKLNDKRIVTFVDLAGHETYLKTTLNGLTASLPDFAIVCISDKITKMTKEHMGLCMAMSIPFVILFTKIDLIPSDVTDKLISNVKILLNRSNRKLLQIKEEKDWSLVSAVPSNLNGSAVPSNLNGSAVPSNLSSSHCVPFILTSNKTNHGIDLVKFVLGNIPKKEKNLSPGFLVEHIYNVQGHGTVLTGFSGFDIRVGDLLYMGPFNKGDFVQTTVRSIHNDYRYEIKHLSANTKGCLAVNYKNKEKYTLRKGMILAKEPPKNICHEFEAKVHILHHHTTIKKGYCAFINCGTLREAVNFVNMYDSNHNALDAVRSGDHVTIHMKFVRCLNYLEIGQQLAFREGQTRGVGTITKLYR